MLLIVPARMFDNAMLQMSTTEAMINLPYRVSTPSDVVSKNDIFVGLGISAVFVFFVQVAFTGSTHDGMSFLVNGLSVTNSARGPSGEYNLPLKNPGAITL